MAIKKKKAKKKAKKKKAVSHERPLTFRARTVLDHAKSSVQNFFKAFETVRESRGAGQGAPTDEEQDLLRSALIFAAAGLDSILKQLIREALPSLAEFDPFVEQEFETFVQRQLRGDSENPEGAVGHRFLARLLVSSSPYKRLLEDYVLHLTGTSLQSVEQLFKTTKALGIDSETLKQNREKLTNIFEIRNKIIHELDVAFAGGRGQRMRNRRTRPSLEEYTRILIALAEEMIDNIETKLEIVD